MALSERQQWRTDIIKHYLAHNTDKLHLNVSSSLHTAECYTFQNELIVPYDDESTKQKLIAAIKEVLPNFDGNEKIRAALNQES